MARAFCRSLVRRSDGGWWIRRRSPGQSSTANATHAVAGPGVLASGSLEALVDEAAKDFPMVDLAVTWLLKARQ